MRPESATPVKLKKLVESNWCFFATSIFRKEYQWVLKKNYSHLCQRRREKCWKICVFQHWLVIYLFVTRMCNSIRFPMKKTSHCNSGNLWFKNYSKLHRSCRASAKWKKPAKLCHCKNLKKSFLTCIFSKKTSEQSNVLIFEAGNNYD